jgi:SsrA-binding protein
MSNYIQNKKASFDYDILEDYEAGIELHGYEVKSVRAKHGKLEGAHVTIRGSEAFLIGANIPAFQPANAPKNYDPARNRKLLLNKKEIAKLGGNESERGLTIVPISMYNKGRLIKVKIAVARGKKKFDKRETLKRRDTEREVRREMKERR